jgi:hypothetical protein
MVKIDESCAAAYEDVRNDKTETNFLVMSYPEGKDELTLLASGSGGLAELSAHLKPDIACFSYIRMTIGNDELSQRGIPLNSPQTYSLN